MIGGEIYKLKLTSDFALGLWRIKTYFFRLHCIGQSERVYFTKDRDRKRFVRLIHIDNSANVAHEYVDMIQNLIILTNNSLQGNHYCGRKGTKLPSIETT